MCDVCDGESSTTTNVTRRALLGAAVATLVAGELRGRVAAMAASTVTAPKPKASVTSVAAAKRAIAMPAIIERQSWGGDLPVKGQLQKETPKFLLVHHTLLPNSDYGRNDPPRMLRQVYAFHTGKEKGWPDVAYNFFVDKFGRIYEGRTGSISGPVRGSATGGNQGYSQLCCFLGDTSKQPPTPEAQRAMVDLLAWLADRFGIDTRPGATTSFTSLGSNRHKAGTTVVARTISGHRDMSLTECPGDACYALIANDFPTRVAKLRAR